ncbi:MAG: hypothetical protein K2X82_25950 [Gemmataceae bacterium]|nr:hypothetical protein [Gemmataceae bacterium]
MDEYLAFTLLSAPGEAEAAFKARLSGLWTAMLREQPDEFERVYAEQVAFDRRGDRLGRKYLVEAAAVPAVEAAATAAGLEWEPVDPDDVYSKYEAAPPDWFWIEH